MQHLVPEHPPFARVFAVIRLRELLADKAVQGLSPREASEPGGVVVSDRSRIVAIAAPPAS